ncbi:SAM-dependent methyltransferase, partial [Aliivibrio sifiae]
MIKPALLDKKIEKPHSWSDIPHGEWIGELIQSRLDEWCPKLFGYHMLKIGGLSAELDSRFCNIKHQVNLDNKNSLKNIVSELPQLPFLEKSIDACVL